MLSTTVYGNCRLRYIQISMTVYINVAYGKQTIVYVVAIYCIIGCPARYAKLLPTVSTCVAHHLYGYGLL